ncbi:MAG: prephenate dehydrogenase [Candidatus Bipolaricaulia bacterium]
MVTDWPQRIAIVGLGLIGGSLGLAIRQRRPGIHVVGIDRDEATLERARARGAIDDAHSSWTDGIPGADLVVLATPVSVILEQLERLPELLDEEALVTDVGSTKRAIHQRGRAALGERFIGGHPLAGSDRAGIDAARTGLFRDRTWVLTGGDSASMAELGAFLGKLGARVTELNPSDHDRVVAATSHLPQLLAIALGARLDEGAADDDAYRRLLATGGDDWLRLARASADVWRDIVATNADRIRDEVHAVVAHLRALDRDLDHLESAFERANRLAIETQNGIFWDHTNGGDITWRPAKRNS